MVKNNKNHNNLDFSHDFILLRLRMHPVYYNDSQAITQASTYNCGLLASG